MEKLFLGCFLSPTIEEQYVKDNKNQYVISATTFQRAMLSSINLFSDISIINAPDIGSWPYRSNWLRFRKRTEVIDGVKCRHVSFFNITYLKQICIYKSLFREIREWVTRNKTEKLIIVYSLLYPYLKAAIDIKRKYPGTKICCIVLDLPEFFNDKKTMLSKFFDKTNEIYNLTKEIDSFVLLTKQMADVLKTNNRPYMILEGIYQNRYVPKQNKCPKSILYTGKLDARFGLKELVKAFMDINDKDAQLWICGTGIDKEYVIESTLKDSRIKYYGLVRQNIVFKMQKQASILVNPRRPEGEYTKYSFPSKTMEYLASGTTTVMYHLPGLPDEYLPFIKIIDADSESGLKDILISLLSTSSVELNEFGANARNFILNNKTSEIQMNRLNQFIEKNYEK